MALPIVPAALRRLKRFIIPRRAAHPSEAIEQKVKEMLARETAISPVEQLFH